VGISRGQQVQEQGVERVSAGFQKPAGATISIEIETHADNREWRSVRSADFHQRIDALLFVAIRPSVPVDGRVCSQGGASAELEAMRRRGLQPVSADDFRAVQ